MKYPQSTFLAFFILVTVIAFGTDNIGSGLLAIIGMIFCFYSIVKNGRID